jgi:hypothetical protein
MLNSFKKLITAASLALVATFGFSHDAMAQKGGNGVLNGAVTWPTVFNIGFGAEANDNWQGSGAYLYPGPDGGSYAQSSGFANPEFHINMEIPIAENMMFAPRIAYNDYSVRWDNSQGKQGDPAALNYQALGADLLLKYSLNNFHVMAGGNVSTPLSATVAHSYRIEDATHSSQEISLDKSNVIASIKGGLGYDIPLTSSNTMWITPEAFFTYPITNFQQTENGSELFVTSISGGASLKFALP